MKVNIALADDQQLFLKSLGTMINSFSSFQVVFDALNGEDLLRQLDSQSLIPEIILVDVNMPVMAGLETGGKVNTKNPLVKLAALTINDEEATVIETLKPDSSTY